MVDASNFERRELDLLELALSFLLANLDAATEDYAADETGTADMLYVGSHYFAVPSEAELQDLRIKVESCNDATDN